MAPSDLPTWRQGLRHPVPTTSHACRSLLCHTKGHVAGQRPEGVVTWTLPVAALGTVVVISLPGPLFSSPESSAAGSIEFMNLATNEIRPLASFEKPSYLATAGLAVSPDGQWILYGQVEQAGSELMLVENFH